MVWTNSQLPQNTTRIVSDDYFVEQDGLTFAGTHLLLDLWGADNLEDSEQVEKVLSEAAEAAGATVLHAHIHRFESGGGVSGVVVLAESHISIHTWPERNFAALDIFMCGACDPYKSIPKIRNFFSPDKLNVSEQKRGVR
jgi:S-adenosylmethionine decarboxylase